MSEAKEPQDKKLSLSGGPRTLQMKKTVDTGEVRQNFSHGRSKAVVVERKKKRIFFKSGTQEEELQKAEAPPGETLPPAAASLPIAEVPELEPAPPAPDSGEPQEEDAAARSARGRVVLRTLTEDEKSARAKALEGAIHADQVARERAAEVARQDAKNEARLQVEREAAERRQEEEEARKKADEDSRRRAEVGATARAAQQDEGLEAGATAFDRRHAMEEEDRKRLSRSSPGRASPIRRTEPRRRGGKLTVSSALQGDSERQRSLASVRRARERDRRSREDSAHGPPQKVVRDVVVPETITVQELANRMAERAADVIKALMEMGVMSNVSEIIDQDTAELIVEQFGHRMQRVSESDVEEGLMGEEDDEKDLASRPPVVTVMGHVDHGKTSLLDALRQTDVVAGEAGGITQHIGAYQVTLSDDSRITFLDTPGHEAFSAMRARGAGVTDIVVLVVAADDGVMPQTVEAINHAKAAGVPIIVAINKMDTKGADANRVRQELLQHELVCEEMGGEVLSVEVSATKKTNLDKLEEVILLQSELLELRVNPNRNCEGTVVEAKIDKGRGSLATILVQRGTLRTGDIFVAGSVWGRVRALISDQGQPLKEAGPSVPVEVLGFQDTPTAGDEFAVVESESKARQIAEFRESKSRATGSEPVARATFDEIFAAAGDDGLKTLPLVIKTDVQGSAEAISGSLAELNTDEVAVQILHSGAGGITESDITLAAASGGIIVAFNVRGPKPVLAFAESEGVEIRYYAVIYELIDEIKAQLSGMLKPEIRETTVGSAEILEIFNIGKFGKVAGCKVLDGAVRRDVKARVTRDEVVVYEGSLASLRRFKDEVKEVNSGNECGMSFENYQDVKPGDRVEFYEVEEIARSL